MIVILALSCQEVRLGDEVIWGYDRHAENRACSMNKGELVHKDSEEAGPADDLQGVWEQKFGRGWAARRMPQTGGTPRPVGNAAANSERAPQRLPDRA